MTKTEEQLRDALTAIAALLQGTQTRTAPAPERRSWHLGGWLIPAAVATAVLLIVVVGVVAAAGLNSSGNKHGPAAKPAGVSSRFFMTIISGSATTNQGAAVRDVTTGKVTAIVAKPQGMNQWDAISATANNTVFYLAASPPLKVTPSNKPPVAGSGSGSSQLVVPGPNGNLKQPGSRLYRLKIDGSGKVVDLAEVKKVTGLPYIRRFAASPDGKRIATTDDRGPRYARLKIYIYDLTAGHRQTFELSTLHSAESLSWSADGRWLAFDGGYSNDNQDAGIRVLDTRARGDLTKPSRMITQWERGPLGLLTTPVLSADGTKLYVIAAQKSPAGGPTWTRVIEIDAASGRQLRALYEQRFTGDHVIWMFHNLARDTASKNLLIIANGYGHRIDIATGKSTRIPFPDGDPNTIAW